MLTPIRLPEWSNLKRYVFRHRRVGFFMLCKVRNRVGSEIAHRGLWLIRAHMWQQLDEEFDVKRR